MIAVPSVDPALGVRAVGDGRPPVRLRGGAGDRRVGAPAARGMRGHRARRRRGRVAPTAMLAAVRRGIARRSPSSTSTALRGHRYDGHLEASTAVRLAGLLRDVRVGPPGRGVPGRASGKVGSPAALVDDLVAALTRAIEELTRPVDAIKHQAKTVTVGISRSDEGVIDRALVQAVLDAGAGRDVLSYRTLKVLADLDPAVAEVTGFTRYGIDGDTDHRRRPRRHLPRRSPSRVERNPVLVGTKRRRRQRARGARRPRPQRRPHGDLRAGGQGRRRRPASRCCTCGSTTASTPPTMRGVLQGYDRRYDRLVDWVTETEGAFDDRLLGELPVDELLIEPISDTADHWRTHRELAASSHVMIGIGVDVGRHRALPAALAARTPSMRDAAVHADRARLRRAEGRPGAVAGGPLRRARGGDEGARARASARSASTTCGSRSTASGRAALVVDGRGARAGRRPRRRALAPVAQPRRAGRGRRWSSPSESRSHRDPDRHAGARWRRSTPPRRSRSRCSSSGPARPSPGSPADARRHVRPPSSTSSPARATTAPTAGSAAELLAERGVARPGVRRRRLPAGLPPADLVIDAAYGTGFHGDVEGAPDVGRHAGARRRHPERRRRAHRAKPAAACSPPTAR